MNKHDLALAAMSASTNKAQVVVALSYAYPDMDARLVSMGMGATAADTPKNVFRFPDGSMVHLHAGKLDPVEYIGG